MVAVLLEKGQECANCGSAEWQWKADAQAFVAVEHTCPGCAAKDRLRASQDSKVPHPGVSIRLVTRDTAATLAARPRKRPMSARERARMQA